MSKMDNLRAMREARYERTAAAGSKKPAATTKAAARPGPALPGRRPALPRWRLPPPSHRLDESACGHRAISGRTCTREHGHAEKSHRYS